MARTATKSVFTAELMLPAIRDSFLKMDPRQLIRNPVIFVTACVALLLTVLLFIGHDALTVSFKAQIIVWLWLTVLFGTFAEALAEGRGKAQAAALRATKADLTAKRLRGLIAQKTPSLRLLEAARAEGMRTIREATIEKVLQGVTTVSEMVRVSGV